MAPLLPVLLLAAAAASAPAPAVTPIEQEVDLCMSCHGDKDARVELPGGEKLPLFVDRAAFASSIHARDLRCTDCHAGMDEIPHPERNVKSTAEFHAGFRDACKACHFDKYALSQGGVHYKQFAMGNDAAPGCVDCHGAHDVFPAAKPRSRISDTCSGCHPDVADTYLKSVHGKAMADGNPDVPVCTDCHRAHDISDPRVESWIVKTPELCAHCHTDKTMMAKYGLSTAVVDTYLSDFHGVTSTLSRARGSSAERRAPVTALCIDCHGVHDITKTGDARSPVLRANLVKTCRKCHPDASESFPDAWLSHYEPSFAKTPLVYGVKIFYGVFIPFIIGGLVLQVLLHLWRVVVNR
ncbi:MAG TPA: cytochrome c3 family protein [Candidatus Polarisedimenticolaceae bacterium]|nr:cytochrome c3 family protein [Candidatus Polarisedimenticolaceae bacterium]